jgi:hypothetical protein
MIVPFPRKEVKIMAKIARAVMAALAIRRRTNEYTWNIYHRI